MKTTMNRYSMNALMATRVLLRRVSTSQIWRNLKALLGKFAPQLHVIICETLTQFVEERGHLLTRDVPASYIGKRVDMYKTAVYEKNQRFENCAAFIDWTVVGMALPDGHSLSQRVVYNGQKHRHAIKCQSLTTLDGVCVHLHRPKVWPRHKMLLYAESGLNSVPRQVLVEDRRHYVVFRDLDYS